MHLALCIDRLFASNQYRVASYVSVMGPWQQQLVLSKVRHWVL